MVEQKKRTRTTQSELRHQLRHPGRVLDLKTKDLIGHLWVSLIIDQSECLVCFLFLHWINSLLHCLKKTALVLTNQNGEIFSCILLEEKWEKMKNKLKPKMGDLDLKRLVEQSRPFPNYLKPRFQSESWCSSFHMKISFHMKKWAPGLALKKRPKVIRKFENIERLTTTC